MANRFQWPILIAAALVIPAIIIEESADPGSALYTVGRGLDWLIWILFAAEFAAMLTVVPSKWEWIRHHPLDVAIVLLTAPMLPAAFRSARVIRLLRVLRLIRLAQLSRRLFSLRGVRDVSVLALLTVIGGGLAFAAVEQASQPKLKAWDGVWWALTTLTSVGYGDVKITTTLGRVIGIAVMCVGTGFIALLTAAAAQWFIRQSHAEREEVALLKEVLARLDALEVEQRKPS
jgi:voltage-gated potassium channel